MKFVNFLGYDCEIGKITYHANKQPGLRLFAADTSNNRDKELLRGEPFMFATACLEEYPFKEGETAIKDYSENAGIFDVLIKAKIVEPTGKYAYSGYCSLPVVKLLI